MQTFLEPPSLPPKILNVDDYDAVRYTRSSVLKKAGFQILEAANGQQALELVRREQPDLVILDVHMPGMNGYEVAQAIKSNAETARVMVLQMSATLSEPHDRAHALDIGADSFLIEPAEPEELIATVRALLRLAAAERALAESEKLWRATFSLANDIMLLLDADLKIVAANRKALETYGYTQSRLIGMNLADLRSPAERAALAEHFRDVQDNGGTFYQTEHQTADGRIFPVESSAQLISLGQVKHYVVLVRDVSEREQLEHDLGLRLDERMAQLLDLNSALRAEAEQRQRSEAEARRAYQELRRVTAGLEEWREAERLRISRELHDELGQALTALKFDLSSLLDASPNDPLVRERAAAMEETIDASITSVRRIAADLRPGMLDDLGLAPAIEWKAQDFQQRTGIECVLSLPRGTLSLTSSQTIAIFRIVQEALTNIMRHSGATRAEIQMRVQDKWLHLNIHDNGNGFDPHDLGKTKSLGVLGMRERAVMVGGTLAIESAPEGGTTVKLVVPLDAPASGVLARAGDK